MVIVHVHIHVKSDQIKEFKQATLQNARNSLQEPGVARFDFLQMQSDPTRFLLIEVYRNESDIHAHKETAHYQTWRDTVADMMAEPRQGIKYVNLFPDQNGWN